MCDTDTILSCMWYCICVCRLWVPSCRVCGTVFVCDTILSCSCVYVIIVCWLCLLDMIVVMPGGATG